MKQSLALLLCGLAVGLIATTEQATSAPAATAMPSGFDAAQAHIDYKLKCQGCHRPDGSGDDHSNPPLRGMVARFLGVAGGREFLARVPGVATTNLDDKRLANLLNWTLFTFDPLHISENFRPYTAAELRALRQNPLRLERAETRARLVAGFTHAKT
jgi:mono/diheme cytochrome c family protein